jgi:gliding motility-associated protein GldM
MMYLVLTALLALNVSSEILNAFRTVNSSLMNANGIIEAKNAGIFSSFNKKLQDPKQAEKARIWKAKADQAKKVADDMFSYIESLKTDLMKEAGQKEPGGTFKEDNLDAATRLLVEGGKGKLLHQKLEEYKKALLAIDPEIRAEFEKTLPIDLSVPKSQHKGNHDWESAYFRMTPTIAALTMLSKFENDVKNSEAQVLDFCHRKVGEVEVVYNEFQAFAGTNSQYLMPGQELVITAGVGAFSKAAKPNITVDGSGVGLNAEGVAEYKTTVGGPGTYTKVVNINFVKPDGSTASVQKKVEYTVGSPTGASVSADAVKVLYIGLENPLTITGGTAGDEKTTASITNGSLKKTGPGKYVANVSSPGEATVNVSVEGKSTPFKFRVKRVPDPTPMVGASQGGRIPANAIKAQAGVRADLKDFVFEGVKFDIIGFTLYATGRGFEENPGISPNPGAYFSGESKRILEKSRPGSTIVIDEIKARGPDGGTRTLPTMAFNLY